MSENHAFYAFVATLVALIAVVGIGAWLASSGKYSEALGVGGVGTGLIGVLGTFKPRNNSGPNVEQADTVNQGGAA